MPSLPEFNAAGVLPTFVGRDATNAAFRSPFTTSIYDVVERLGKTQNRGQLLLGFNAYRKHLYDGGFTGCQWVGGSFVEDCENTRGRTPGDIDVLTLFRPPLRYQNDRTGWDTDYRDHLHLEYFSPKAMKSRFACDTYPLDLELPAERLVDLASYWYGFLSETRMPSTRKGIIKVPLMTDVAEYIAVQDRIRKVLDV